MGLCQWARCPLNNDGLLSKYVHQTVYVCVCVFQLQQGIGRPSVYHAVVVIFLEFFAWGLLTTPMLTVSKSVVTLPSSNQTLLSPPAHVNDSLVFSPHPNTTLVVTPVFGLLV